MWESYLVFPQAEMGNAPVSMTQLASPIWLPFHKALFSHKPKSCLLKWLLVKNLSQGLENEDTGKVNTVVTGRWLYFSKQALKATVRSPVPMAHPAPALRNAAIYNERCVRLRKVNKPQQPVKLSCDLQASKCCCRHYISDC